ncbi:MAG: hypothetical protein ACK4H7_03475, partial [Acidilobaceae archaeon]
HSVFVLDEETLEVKVKKVEELKRGDLLVTFRGVESSVWKADVAPFNAILPHRGYYNPGVYQVLSLDFEPAREGTGTLLIK